MNQKLLSSIYISSSILIFFLLVLPAFDKTRMLRQALAERSDMYAELQEISKSVEELNRGVDEKKGDIAKLDQLLPKQKDVSEMISAIENIVSSAGLNLSEISFSELKGEGISVISGSIKLTGGFNSFVSFLDLMEKNLRLVEINMIDIAPQSGGLGANTINYDVKFSASFINSQ